MKILSTGFDLVLMDRQTDGRTWPRSYAGFCNF